MKKSIVKRLFGAALAVTMGAMLLAGCGGSGSSSGSGASASASAAVGVNSRRPMPRATTFSAAVSARAHP